MFDIGYEQFMRDYDYAKHLPLPQYSIEKPNHLEIFDDNYEEFHSLLQNFDTKIYYNNAPHNVKKCIKANKRKYSKINLRSPYSLTCISKYFLILLKC